ncbi:MAG: flavodoxin, partial [Parabacteroides sp.]
KDYDVIYLGYPIWWGTMPMAVYTFLASYDFTGKTIIPFCTHEGSDLGSSVQDIKKVCPKARVLQGLAIKGSNVNDPESDKTVAAWIKKSK